MANSISFTKTSGVIGVAVNGGAARTLAKANNVTVKPLTAGVVIKLTDDSWRKHVNLEDTVTKDGVPASPYADVAAMVTDLSAYFG